MKDKVRIGIIGTGFARKVQIPAFLACENAEVVSVASGSLANAERTAQEFNIGHFTDDWHEIHFSNFFTFLFHIFVEKIGDKRIKFKPIF